MKYIKINYSIVLSGLLALITYQAQAQLNSSRVWLHTPNNGGSKEGILRAIQHGTRGFDLRVIDDKQRDVNVGLIGTLTGGTFLGTWAFPSRPKLDGSQAGMWIEAGSDDWFVGRLNTSNNTALRFYARGEKMVLTQSGSLGIGTTTPTSYNAKAKLTVRSGDIQVDGGSFSSYGTLSFRPDTDDSGDDAIVFKNNAENETMRIHTNDNVGIGTNNPLAKLHINGTGKFTGALSGTSASFSGNLTSNSASFASHVQAGSLSLSVGSFPDYVFAKSYDLMPLEDLDTYIQKNHHLPKVPKAEKVIKEGLNVAKINVLLMEKVEELTLHTIEQNKQIKALMQRVEKLEKAIQNKN